MSLSRLAGASILAAAALFSRPAGAQSQSIYAQSQTPAPYQIYAGYSWQSNTFNGLPGSHQGMNGANAGIGLPAWHGLRARIEFEHFTADNLGAREKAWVIAGGGQYEHAIGRERLFADALFGDVAPNRFWGPKGQPGESASFTEIFGGGVDTPISRHFAIRVEGDFHNENLALIKAVNNQMPYRVPGLPQNFFTLSSSLVWTPKLGVMRGAASAIRTTFNKSVDQELIVESTNSFGHVKIFANSWWSYLNTGGIEYDRHSWGYALGARLDYVAEVLPYARLRQPTKTDVYGNNLSGTERTSFQGLGISPAGLRMMWNDHGFIKPFYEIKGGMIAFTQKALSKNAAYENFSLQQILGAQFRVTDRVGFRAGIEHFHFSNAFVVPSNPGLDAMSWTAGLSIRINKTPQAVN